MKIVVKNEDAAPAKTKYRNIETKGISSLVPLRTSTTSSSFFLRKFFFGSSPILEGTYLIQIRL